MANVMHSHPLIRAALGGVLLGTAFLAGIVLRPFLLKQSATLRDTIASQTQLLPSAPKPLEKYSFRSLRQTPLLPSKIIIDRALTTPVGAPNTKVNTYVFHFTTLGRKMSGVITTPTTTDTNDKKFPVVVMVRGYVPLEQYRPGMGTQAAANVFAEDGYVTVAPDFMGYGESEPEASDPWESRFQKPLQLAELIRSLQESPEISLPEGPLSLDPERLGIWAHSNGGQIALSTLALTSWEIPTTLWAPVTAPFPYAVLYFSDEEEDEGRVSRLWIADFDKNYNALEFSLTRHIGWLRGPLQIHHGDTDDAALRSWSDDFVARITTENARRAGKLPPSATPSARDTVASPSASPSGLLLSTPVPSPSPLPSLSPDPGLSEHWPAIAVTYFTYPATDHNMRPNWQRAVDRDRVFFEKHLR